MTDLPACEWHPASHRFTGDPVAAVARLSMPPAVRTVLVDKMSRHAFDDVVRITWSGVSSESGLNQYAAVIANMNFASGRLCRSVTRTHWTTQQAESAIVYIVGDRSFGYASACGNLFELTRLEPPVAEGSVPGTGGAGAATEAVFDASPTLAAAPTAQPLAGTPDSPLSDVSGDAYPAFGYVGSPGLNDLPVIVLRGKPPSVALIPEPHSGLLLLSGLALMAAFRLRACK